MSLQPIPKWTCKNCGQEVGEDFSTCPECFTERSCKVCGCTDNNACEGGCYWIAEDLCSQCEDKLPDGDE